jgi:hypothetical protein
MLHISSLVAIWKFRKLTCLQRIVIKLYGTKFLSKNLCALTPNGIEASNYLHLYLHLQILVYILWHHKFKKFGGLDGLLMFHYGPFSWYYSLIFFYKYSGDEVIKILTLIKIIVHPVPPLIFEITVLFGKFRRFPYFFI